MAVFHNQATISYGGIVRQSNITSGQIVDTVTVTKTPLTGTYGQGTVLTYVVNIRNEGDTPLAALTLTDDLGAYVSGTATYVPLTYVDGTLKVFRNGTEQPAPVVTADPSLTAVGIDIPVGEAATVVYEAQINEYAPLGTDGTGEAQCVVNTVSVTGEGITDAATATAEVTAQTGPDLSVNKCVSPSTVTENGRVTYTFVISNAGTATEAADDVVLTDVFDPVLTDLTVVLDGQTLEAGSGYTYDGTTGTFETAQGVVTVPGAAYQQDPDTGVWTTEPGSVTLTVSGNLGSVQQNAGEKKK